MDEKKVIETLRKALRMLRAAKGPSKGRLMTVQECVNGAFYQVSTAIKMIEENEKEGRE